MKDEEATITIISRNGRSYCKCPACGDFMELSEFRIWGVDLICRDCNYTGSGQYYMGKVGVGNRCWTCGDEFDNRTTKGGNYCFDCIGENNRRRQRKWLKREGYSNDEIEAKMKEYGDCCLRYTDMKYDENNKPIIEEVEDA